MEYITLILIGIISRLVPHLPNMTPVGATALFTGSKYGMKKAFVVTTLTMLVTDLIIGLHPVMWATYGSFFITIFIGRMIAGKKNAGKILAASLLSSAVFFIITNLAVWLVPGSMYPRTLSGLLYCYIMALPFFRNMLIGDLFYTTVFFGGLELVKALRKKIVLMHY